jgi:hypothetical protein
LKEEINKFLIPNYMSLAKNANLSFLEGQNCVGLALRLTVLIISELSVDAKLHAASTALKAIGTAINSSPSEEISIEIFISALFILLKCGLPEEGKAIIINLGLSIFKVKDIYKDCWLFLLELFSTHFNPEKKGVTVDENRFIGQILKNLILNIPHLEL